MNVASASSDGSPFPSGSGLWKRPASSSLRTPPPSSGGGGPLRLGGHPCCYVSLTNINDPLYGQFTHAKKPDVEIGRINVVTWIDCLDLRVLAVLANSTLSSTILSKHVYFSLYVPESEDMKLFYYKLKVLFPDSNLELFGQNEVKHKLNNAAPEWESRRLSIYELSPFIIPSTKPSLTKFAFVSPNTIIKGSIEELFGFDLGPYTIAAAEDCTKRLGEYVNIDILNAIQRTAAMTWISDKPYDKDSCVPDLNLFLVDATKLDKNFIESILWWDKVLNLKHERNNPVNMVIAVAFYNRYFKLPDAWKHANSRTVSSEAKVLRYDGPSLSCSEHKIQNEPYGFGKNWQQYLPPKSDVILAN
ncbi:uncharacterized protein LOC110030458 [Phalaenopsis equestris]|uniref:uncharacterized protein LOC110030458 n=1 Tax=Phalaenopsis equestris TaxID=78828 RepID=UPI0009E2CCC2|nr:uncharacterized protein LOC110030458 [Phalaenopsis equestris]